MFQDTKILLDRDNLLVFQFHEFILIHNAVPLTGGQLTFSWKSTLIAQIEQRFRICCFPVFRDPWTPRSATFFHLDRTIQSMGYCVADHRIAILFQCLNGCACQCMGTLAK